MKKLSIFAMIFVLTATVLTGCRRPTPGTTNATNNNTSTSTVRPEPTITKPDTSSTAPGSSSANGGQRQMGSLG